MKFHFIPCDHIQYVENNVYLFFTSLWLVYFITGSLYLLIPLPTSSSPQSPSFLPATSLHFKPYTPVIDAAILFCCRRHGCLRYDWLPCVFQAVNTRCITCGDDMTVSWRMWTWTMVFLMLHFSGSFKCRVPLPIDFSQTARILSSYQLRVMKKAKTDSVLIISIT